MNLVVNGETFEAKEAASIQSLIESLELSAKRIAVELNGSVVRRVEWDSLLLSEGDRVEIVHFVGGG
jgi:sulfur carrier protein